MHTLKQWFQNPKLRRQTSVIASAALIATGLLAKTIWGYVELYNGMMALAALAAGWEIALRAWNNLRNKAFSIELLVTIASTGALVIGEYWEAAAVTFLFILGAFLEAHTLNRTRKVMGELIDLAPTNALVLREGRQVEVSPQEVGSGETVLLKPGMKAPVDGIVFEGRSAVDESAITGESLPKEKADGSLVYAGSVNQNGVLKMRATGIGADTTLARIIRRVEEAQDEKAPTQKFIERFARWYTPAIIALSIAVFAITRDIELSLTLLVIGCPGALVISTPVSVVTGIGRAAKKGILIKGGEYLENAGKISAVALDKTGTLTAGKPRLTDIIVFEGQSVLAGSPFAGQLPFTSQRVANRWTAAQTSVLRWAGIAEANSEHPLAQSIMKAVDELGEIIPNAVDFETRTGRGILANYLETNIAVGTVELMKDLDIEVDFDVEKHLDELKTAGKTAVAVAVNQRIVGILGIADTIREDAAEMVRRLRQNGVQKVIMLTGDDRRVAQAIARQAGISEVYAELLPEDKLDVIRRLKQDGHVVAMTGDGINDAPALAAADLGIAMGMAGTALAIETADIALMGDDLMKIPEAIRLSKAALRNIRQNVVIALVTVALLLTGVLVGEIHMAGGMLIHQASVLIVILNGLRLMRA